MTSHLGDSSLHPIGHGFGHTVTLSCPSVWTPTEGADTEPFTASCLRLCISALFRETQNEPGIASFLHDLARNSIIQAGIAGGGKGQCGGLVAALDGSCPCACQWAWGR